MLTEASSFTLTRRADDEYELIVSVPGQKEKTFTLQDLKTKFPKYEVVSTIQCAGNRNEVIASCPALHPCRLFSRGG